MRISLFKLFLLILIFLCQIEPVAACSCVPQPSPCEAFKETPVVFVGRVVRVKEEKSEFTRFGVKENIRTGLIATFNVEERLKGISQTEVDIVTGGGGGDCGYYFEEGEQYLVYAWSNRKGDQDDKNRISSTHLAGSGVKVLPGTLSASICSRTRKLKFAGDDLVLIRALLKGAPENRIFGTVSERAEQFSETGSAFPQYLGPMTGVLIKAVGASASYEARTDAQGEFKFINLNPGKYKISLTMPEHRALLYDFDRSELEIDIPSGCFAHEMGFDLQVDGRIGGRVFDADGKPVGEQVQVSLISADDAGKEMSTLLKMDEYTDEQGRYSFDGILPGRYVLGISIAEAPYKNTPYLKTYYPTGVNHAQAQVISLAFGQKISGLDFHLPPRLETFTITGVVVDEKGRPVLKANVDLYDQENPSSEVFGADVETDRLGRFTIKGFKGRRYLVHAYKDKDYFAGTGRQAISAEIIATKPGKPIRLVLNQAGIFRHQLQKPQNSRKESVK